MSDRLSLRLPLVLALDTNALPRGKASLLFSRLGELARQGLIELIISEISLREWQSHRDEDIEKHFMNASRSISSVAAASLTNAAQRSLNRLAQMSLNLAKLKTDCLRHDKTMRKEFVKGLRAKVIPLRASDHNEMIAACFNGNPPFTSVRSKADIPDALIWASCKRYVKDRPKKSVFFISEDKGFSFLRQRDIHLKTSLEGFFQDLDISNFIAHERVDELSSLEIALTNFNAAHRYSRDGNPILGPVLLKVSELLEGRLLNDPRIPGINAVIRWANNDALWRVLFNEAKSIGGGVFLVPFSARWQVWAEVEKPSAAIRFVEKRWFVPAGDDWWGGDFALDVHGTLAFRVRANTSNMGPAYNIDDSDVAQLDVKCHGKTAEELFTQIPHPKTKIMSLEIFMDDIWRASGQPRPKE